MLQSNSNTSLHLNYPNRKEHGQYYSDNINIGEGFGAWNETPVTILILFYPKKHYDPKQKYKERNWYQFCSWTWHDWKKSRKSKCILFLSPPLSEWHNYFSESSHTSFHSFYFGGKRDAKHKKMTSGTKTWLKGGCRLKYTFKHSIYHRNHRHDREHFLLGCRLRKVTIPEK